MAFDRPIRDLVLVLSGFIPPLALGQPWLPDADGDGHPLFGETAQRVSFEPHGNSHLAVAFGDLDGDGHVDAAVVMYAHVSVLFGTGDGVFRVGAKYPVSKCVGVTIGDFNGDSALDIAATQTGANSVALLLNQGDGTFAEPAAFAVGNQPRSIVCGDFDGDGRLDFATLNCLGNDVSIRLGNGDGTFKAEKRVSVGNATKKAGPEPYPGPHMALGDLDGDGWPDIAVPAQDRVRILINNGAGGFSLSPVQPKAVVGTVYAVVIGDLDRDGVADLATVSTGAPTKAVSVMLGIGGGEFAAAAPYDCSTWGKDSAELNNALAIGDIDGDGAPELVVGREGNDFFAIMWNGGDGTFTKEVRTSKLRTWATAVEDLNGDGWRDVAVLHPMQGRGSMRVQLNDGAGWPIRAAEFWNWPTNLYRGGVAADLDLDGRTDLALASWTSPYAVQIHRNDGAGGLVKLPPIALGEGPARGNAIAAGDLNGDGLPDLVVCDTIDGGFQDPGKIWVLLNTGGMTFAEPVAHEFADSFAVSVALADLDGDGDLDAALWATQVHQGDDAVPVERRVVTMVNDGAGALSWGGEYTVVSEGWPGAREKMLAVGDIDGDGDADIAALSGSLHMPGMVSVLRNDGAGSFTITETYAAPPNPASALLTDTDGDGRPELIVVFNKGYGLEYFPEESYLTIMKNDGAGKFSIAKEYIEPETRAADSLIAARVGGRLGLFFATSDSYFVGQLQTGAYEFDAIAGYAAAGLSNVPRLAAADFDRDGRLDMALPDSGWDLVTIHYGRYRPPCPADCDGSGALTLFDFLCFANAFNAGKPEADCDGNGDLNLFDFLCFVTAFNAGC